MTVKYAKDGNSAVAVIKASTMLQDPSVSAVAVTGVSSLNQHITLMGYKARNGAIELMSEREGKSWRRSITIEANNVDLLIACLTKMSKALKGNHPVAIVSIKNGKIE